MASHYRLSKTQGQKWPKYTQFLQKVWFRIQDSVPNERREEPRVLKVFKINCERAFQSRGTFWVYNLKKSFLRLTFYLFFIA